MNTALISNLSIETELLKIAHNNFRAPLDHLLASAELLTYNKGHILFKVGNIARGMYIINTGKVKLSKFGIDGKEQIIKILHQGDVIGHKALLNDQRFHEYAEVLEYAEIFYVCRQDFENVCTKEISALNYFTQLICNDLDRVEERLVSSAYEPVRGRLASILLELVDIYNDGKCAMINLSRGDLANMAGTAKETAIRLLYELKKEQVLDLDGPNIVIKDFKALRQLAYLYK